MPGRSREPSPKVGKPARSRSIEAEVSRMTETRGRAASRGAKQASAVVAGAQAEGTPAVQAAPLIAQGPMPQVVLPSVSSIMPSKSLS